jgi:hypothetical protein
VRRYRDQRSTKPAIKEVDAAALQRAFASQGISMTGTITCSCGCGRCIYFGRKDGVFCIAPNAGPA